MGIQPIGYQPNFMGKAQTYKGNEYEKTNNGKLIGTGAGAVLSGIMIPVKISGLKKTAEQGFANGRDIFGNDLRAIYKSSDEYLQVLKKGAKIGLPIMTLITLGLGLGIGALVDKSTNNKRAYKADMMAKNAEKENKEAPKA